MGWIKLRRRKARRSQPPSGRARTDLLLLLPASLRERASSQSSPTAATITPTPGSLSTSGDTHTDEWGGFSRWVEVTGAAVIALAASLVATPGDE